MMMIFKTWPPTPMMIVVYAAYFIAMVVSMYMVSRKGYPFLVSLLMACGLTPVGAIILARILPDRSPKRTTPALEDELISAIARRERTRAAAKS